MTLCRWLSAPWLYFYLDSYSRTLSHLVSLSTLAELNKETLFFSIECINSAET